MQWKYMANKNKYIFVTRKPLTLNSGTDQLLYLQNSRYFSKCILYNKIIHFSKMLLSFHSFSVYSKCYCFRDWTREARRFKKKSYKCIRKIHLSNLYFNAGKYFTSSIKWKINVKFQEMSSRLISSRISGTNRKSIITSFKCWLEIFG